MMKILLSVFTILFTISVSAQTIEYLPEFSTKSEDVDLSDDFISSKINAELQNTGQSATSLLWTVEQVEGPEEWQIQLCDKNNCYAWGVMTNAVEGFPTLDLVGGETSIMDLAVRPNGQSGCGRFTISVTNTSSPDDVLAIGTYEFKINTNESCLTSTSDLEEATIKLYPNPTDLSFRLDNAKDLRHIRIINAVGKEVLTSAYTQEREYDISNLTSGLYFVQAQDENGQVLKTLRLIKK